MYINLDPNKVKTDISMSFTEEELELLDSIVYRCAINFKGTLKDKELIEKLHSRLSFMTDEHFTGEKYDQ